MEYLIRYTRESFAKGEASHTELYLLSLTEAARLPEEKIRDAFPERYERALRFRQREDRLRCIGGAALLRSLLGLDESDITPGRNGKPGRRDGGIHFNLSHSGDYILLAVDEREIGADIERVDPRHLSLAPHIFLPEELMWQQEREEERFYTLWTLKESVTKQLGVGLQRKPRSFSVLPLLSGGSICLELRRLYGAALLRDGHCMAVCTERPVGMLSPRLIRAEELNI